MPRFPAFFALVTVTALALIPRQAVASCVAVAGQLAGIVIPARVPGTVVRSGQGAVPVGSATREVVTLDSGT